MAQAVGKSPVTQGYRIRQGNVVGLVARAYQSSLNPNGSVRVVFDDGGEDDLYFDPSVSTTEGSTFLAITKPAKKDGWVLSGAVGLAASGITGRSITMYGQLLILSDVNASATLACIGNGYGGAFKVINVGKFEDRDFRVTWVFQGTVAEDATAGTHVSSLTVTPGAGNEIEVVGGTIINGATATAQTPLAIIDDGTNLLVRIMGGSTGSAVQNYFPGVGPSGQSAGTANTGSPLFARGVIISGTMRLILQVTTTAVSVTQTFAVVCRLNNGLPTATLADTVGAPTLTTNTNAVFG